MFNCGRTRSFKMYELGLFNDIFVINILVAFNNVQLLSSLSISFFFVFRSGRLFITFDIQIDLKMKHLWKRLQKHVQKAAKHQRCRFLS